jgi:hypothetical protein
MGQVVADFDFARPREKVIRGEVFVVVMVETDCERQARFELVYPVVVIVLNDESDVGEVGVDATGALACECQLWLTAPTHLREW